MRNNAVSPAIIIASKYSFITLFQSAEKVIYLATILATINTAIKISRSITRKIIPQPFINNSLAGYYLNTPQTCGHNER